MKRAGLRICNASPAPRVRATIHPFSRVRMKRDLSRRNFLRAGAMAGAAMSTPVMLSAAALGMPATGKPSPIKLGLASYTFRNFSRAQMIGYMQQLGVSDLNAKDVKHHLPTDPALESLAIADNTAAGMRLH